jgi:hypothetical protein
MNCNIKEIAEQIEVCWGDGGGGGAVNLRPGITFR